MCRSARDGFSGCLDYSVLLKIMDLMDIDKDSQLDIFENIQIIENVLHEEHDKKTSLASKQPDNKSTGKLGKSRPTPHVIKK